MPHHRIRMAAPLISDEEVSAVVDVLRSGNLAQGERVCEFEREFAAYVGARHAVAVSSGTAALHLCLSALALRGGRSITSPFTFVATANAILLSGRIPVFADIQENGNISPRCIVDALTDDVDAILPVHLYGNPCDIEAIIETANDHEVHVVEDAAQAHGARVSGRHVGTWGTAGCFSFYPTKNMTTGEGGVVVTSDADLAEQIRMLRNHGQTSRYEYGMLGYNLRMTDIAAALGLVQMRRLDAWNARRRTNARRMIEELEGISWLTLPELTEGHVFHQFTIRVRSRLRDRLAEHLHARGVDTAVHYPRVLYTYPHLQGYASGCRTAERLAGEVLSLPVHPALSGEDILYICESLRLFRP